VSAYELGYADSRSPQPLAPKAKRAKTGNEPKVKDVDTDKEHSKAGPSKRLQEFMDVMKGQEGVVPGGSGGAVPGEEGWVADGLKGKDTAKVKESKKGKEKSVEPEQEDVQEEDDDAAWLKRRQTTALGEGSDSAQDGAPRVSLVNRKPRPWCLYPARFRQLSHLVYGSTICS
jgi:multiple RNA-binding domain-containing protein 1